MTLKGIMFTARYNRTVSIFEEGGFSELWMGIKCLSCSADLSTPASFPLGISPPVAAKGAALLSLQPSMSKEPVLSPYFAVSQSGLLTGYSLPLWSEKAAVKSRLWKPEHENSCGNCDITVTSISLVFSIVIVWCHPCVAFLYLRVCPVHIFIQICCDSEDHKCDFLSWQSLRRMSTSTEGSPI